MSSCPKDPQTFRTLGRGSPDSDSDGGPPSGRSSCKRSPCISHPFATRPGRAKKRIQGTGLDGRLGWAWATFVSQDEDEIRLIHLHILHDSCMAVNSSPSTARDVKNQDYVSLRHAPGTNRPCGVAMRVPSVFGKVPTSRTWIFMPRARTIWCPSWRP